jgi:predicted ATPase
MPWLVDDPGALATLVATANADRMLREFRALVEALTTELTLVLVLEDLHWSDAATVDLLAVLAEGGETGRLMVVGTHRPAELAVREHALLPAMRAMQLRQQCVVLPLHELGPGEVRRYLERRFPGAELPPRLAEGVHAYTDGTPLFVGAIADHLVARGVVLDTAPGWSFVRPIEVAELGVPEDARLMIDVLLAGSSPTDRELLAAASVVGAEFTAQHVAGALGQSLERIEAACEELARAGRFLRFGGTGEWADGGPALRYVFAHELYRRAVYESVPAATRRRLHQRVGKTLEAAWGARSAEIGAELAGHFERGGDVARTVRYLAAAAASARQRFAGREAVGYLTAAIAAAARLGDPLAARREELALRLALCRC